MTSGRLLQHVNVGYPPGTEAEVRAFYAGVLGLDETPKPPEFSPAGMWFQLDGGGQVHLSPREEVAPGAGHFCVEVGDFDALRRRLEAAGASIDEQHPWSGRRRFFSSDPWGQRIEVLESARPAGV